jgi:hypothetical protein
MSTCPARKLIATACFAALVTAAAAARAGDISGQLPETGTHASLTPDFQITNPQNGSATVQPTAIAGIALGADGRAVAGTATGAGGVAGDFQVTSPVKAAGSAIHAVSSAGAKALHPGNYGSAGFFEITSIENTSPTLLAQTGSAFTAALEGVSNGDGDAVDGILNGAGGNAVFGNDASSCCGTAVLGISSNGTDARFEGGADGAGTCTYRGGGAGWSCSSDRNLKEHFTAVDVGAVLDRLDAMPVFYYEMKHSKSPIRYLGPTAQDFKSAFGLGDRETMIASGNEAGVTIAATQALYRKVKDDEAKIAALESQLAKQDAAMASLQSRLSRLLEQIGVREASAGK